MQTFLLKSKAKVSSLKQPRELTTYRRDSSGNWRYDGEGESYFYFPDSYVDRSFDLTAGIGNFKKIPEEQNVGDFTSLLAAIERYERLAGARCDVDIVTFRGIMTKLLTASELKEPFQLKVITYDGTIMIKTDDEAELARRQLQPIDEFQKKCEYSGYKFETLVTLPKPWSHCSRSQIEARYKQPASNYEQFISVVRTGIGKNKILLAGEVDAIFDYKEEGLNLGHYIELKTNRMIYNDNHMRNFEKKLYKTWAQCFLIGIKKIGVGFRDDKMYLKNIEIYETDEVPLLLKDKINCMSSLRVFGGLIEWLKSLIDRTENKSYTLSYDGVGDNVVLLPSNESFENEFLSEEFKSWRNSKTV